MTAVSLFVLQLPCKLDRHRPDQHRPDRPGPDRPRGTRTGPDRANPARDMLPLHTFELLNLTTENSPGSFVAPTVWRVDLKLHPLDISRAKYIKTPAGKTTKKGCQNHIIRTSLHKMPMYCIVVYNLSSIRLIIFASVRWFWEFWEVTEISTEHTRTCGQAHTAKLPGKLRQHSDKRFRAALVAWCDPATRHQQQHQKISTAAISMTYINRCSNSMMLLMMPEVCLGI